MSDVKRTTVFLPDELHDRLRRDAFAAKISMAELIRTRLQRGGGARSNVRVSDPLRKVEGLLRDGFLSAGIDEELYG